MPRLNTRPSSVSLEAHIESISNPDQILRGLTFGLMLAPSLPSVSSTIVSTRLRGWMASPYLHLQVPFPAELDREQP